MAGQRIPEYFLFDANFSPRQQHILSLNAKHPVNRVDELHQKVHVQIVTTRPTLHNPVGVVDAKLNQAHDLQDDQDEGEGDGAVLELEGFYGKFEEAVLEHVFVGLLHLDLVEHLELDFLGRDGRLGDHVDEVGDGEEVGQEDQVLQLHRLVLVHAAEVDGRDGRLLRQGLLVLRLGGVVLQLARVVDQRLLRLVRLDLHLLQVGRLLQLLRVEVRLLGGAELVGHALVRARRNAVAVRVGPVGRRVRVRAHRHPARQGLRLTQKQQVLRGKLAFSNGRRCFVVERAMRVLSRERVPQLDSVWVYLTLPDLAQKKGKGSVK